MSWKILTLFVFLIKSNNYIKNIHKDFILKHYSYIRIIMITNLHMFVKAEGRIMLMI